MIANDPKCVELPTRLKDSKLWEIQRNYFKNQGVDAWDKQVPYYITSNAFMATRYARFVVHFIQDWLSQYPERATETFYLLELGSGTGKFSFHFLKAFETCLRDYNLHNLSFCYVISDVAEKNIQFCEENPSFAEYFSQNKLDIALFNATHQQDFRLQKRKKNFSELHAKTPLMVIANYTFDCVEQDLLFYDGQKYKDVTVGIRSRYPNFDIEKAKHLEDLTLSYNENDIDIQQYYSQPLYNELINHYQLLCNDKPFYLPFSIGAIQFFNALSSMTNNHFALIMGDKGLSEIDDFQLLKIDHLASFDGIFSFLVNFHLLAEITRREQGEVLLSSTHSDFKINLYTKGVPLGSFKNTIGYYQDELDGFTPEDYCDTYKEYLSNSYRFSISSLISFIKLSNYDPDAFYVVSDRIVELIPDMNTFIKKELLSVIKQVGLKVYALPMGNDVHHALGEFYFLINEPQEAIYHFERSIDIFGVKSKSYHMLGVLYEKQRETPKAIEMYHKSFEYDKRNDLSKLRYLRLTGKTTFTWLKPVLKGGFVIALITGVLYFLSRRL